MPKRIQLPDDFYKHDFKQLAKIEKHPRTELDLLDLVIFKMEKATNKWHNISYKV
ncbi:hypothetical protein BSPWISOXPB_8084 [uncultured Gammaproteobacteria bacterium]|nr:hypothetical protein BSPWISOXPB_8084 [uncultured Gammaproteobacteria bacterium]